MEVRRVSLPHPDSTQNSCNQADLTALSSISHSPISFSQTKNNFFSFLLMFRNPYTVYQPYGYNNNWGYNNYGYTTGYTSAVYGPWPQSYYCNNGGVWGGQYW
jgi:hypothetical protein